MTDGRTAGRTDSDGVSDILRMTNNNNDNNNLTDWHFNVFVRLFQVEVNFNAIVLFSLIILLLLLLF